MAAEKRVRATSSEAIRLECFLLCDYARLDNGKLYILGGAWDSIRPTTLPDSFAFMVVLKFALPAQRSLLLRGVTITIHPEASSESDHAESTTTVPVPWGERWDADAMATSTIVMEVSLQINASGRFVVIALADDDEIARTHFRVEAPSS